MTAREKAEEFLLEYEANISCLLPEWENAKEVLAAKFSEAERAGMSKAAEIARGHIHHLSVVDDFSDGAYGAAQEIAQAIEQLKEPKGEK